MGKQAIVERDILQNGVKNIKIWLANMQGKIIRTYIQNEFQMIGHYQQKMTYQKGMYFVRLFSPKGQIMIKVIK